MSAPRAPRDPGGARSMWIFGVLTALAAGFVALALYLIFAVAPVEARMGIVQKIFYFHVPAGMAMVMLAGGCAVLSLLFLVKRKELFDELAVAAAEATFIFATIALITGPLWARKAWSGVWWTWDARLTSTLLLWIVLVGYMMLRSLGGAGGRKYAAGLAVFAGVDAVLVYASVKIWGGQHPIVMQEDGLGSNIHPDMRPALYASMAAYFCIGALLMWLRWGLERARNRVRGIELEMSARGVGDA
jgi:heme exporter protein C